MTGRRLLEIDVGHVVADKYELVRLLGRGSMGQVWVAHHRTLDEHLALKILSPRGDDDEELEDPATAAARFLFEAQVAARLSRRTRHIVRVTDHGVDQGVGYIVMELLEGETLEDVLARDRRVPPPRVAAIVTQIARALVQAHAEGVVHRDLKPANVFLARDEDGLLLVKLLDFGIARATRAHHVRSAFSTAKGLVFGTPCYMSPEQARSSPNLDHQCDLWALATIAFEALTGELPADGADTDETLHKVCAGRLARLRDRAPELPASLEAVFVRAFADSMRARFHSATELAHAIEENVPREAPVVVVAPPALERPPPAPTDGSRWAMQVERRRRRVRTGLAAALVSLVLLLGAGAVWRASTRSSAAWTPASDLRSRAPATAGARTP